MKLTNIAIKNAKPLEKAKKLADGGGLYLEVMPSGSKYWRLKYRFLGKEKRLAFGVYPEVSLSEAREKRESARKLIASGIDPNEEKRLQKLEKQLHYENNFENIAREWHDQRKHTWRERHAGRILMRLEKDIFPAIGARPVKDITAPELLSALKKIEGRGTHDLAHRVKQTCAQIFRYAVATGRAERDITSDLRDALKTAKGKHFAHLSEQELPDFLAKLAEYEEKYSGQKITRLAFQLLIHTFVRSAEARGATWDEFDFDKKQWRIPEERMKMNAPHIVPLTDHTIQILEEIRALTGESYSNYLFPGRQNPRKHMSENTFRRVIEVLGYKGQATAHGFRSTASTILNENGFRPDAIERQLAHAERNKVRAAYNHAEYLEERRVMMKWWSEYLDASLGGAPQ